MKNYSLIIALKTLYTVRFQYMYDCKDPVSLIGVFISFLFAGKLLLYYHFKNLIL